VVGRAPLVEQMRRHPLARALRVDKLTLAALDATLRTWATGRAPVELPVWRMLAAAPDELLARAARWQALLHAAGRDAEVLAGESTIGGGSLPGETLPTWLLALPASGATAELLAAYLRSATPPVICRIAHGHLLFDPRTVAADEEADLLAALLGAPTADSRARQAKRDG